ncbi:DUF5615 family PIN-like protein [Methylobacter tundripaludum]|uniref:DUF5615 family PIN-like protein n=1 Tax=Methylobacter tundripaludum TaxID=173365 RepID=UPI0004DF4F53|nr:DUF5615 family PIN-like protein [Methylobacter tundripaludum]
MKLLFDENLSRRIVPFIQDSYPGSTQVALIGLERVIRQYAINNDYVIVTQDADFYEMGLIHGQPPKIVWLKMGNHSKTTTIKTLLDNKQAIGQALIIDNKACIEIV